MSALKILGFVARFLPRVIQISRRTWIIIGLGLLTLSILLIWAVISLFGWLLGQGQALTEAVPEATRSVISQAEQVVPGAQEAARNVLSQAEQVIPGAQEAARAAVAQAEQVVPGAREAIGGLVSGFAPEAPLRDVSGSDIGPVARFPGLARSHWHQSGQEITVSYTGRADYLAVLDHYVRGFAAQAYAQRIVSAAPDGETHEYRKAGEMLRFKISRLANGKVQVTLIRGQRTEDRRQ